MTLPAFQLSQPERLWAADGSGAWGRITGVPRTTQRHIALPAACAQVP